MSNIHVYAEIAQQLLREYPNSNVQEVNALAYYVLCGNFDMEKAYEYLDALNRDPSEENPTRIQLQLLGA